MVAILRSLPRVAAPARRAFAVTAVRGKHTLPDLPYAYDVSDFLPRCVLLADASFFYCCSFLNPLRSFFDDFPYLTPPHP